VAVNQVVTAPAVPHGERRRFVRVSDDPQRRHLVHLHNCRGAAITLIVITHCMSVFDWSHAPRVEHVLRVILANSAMFFLFISAYLFDYLSSEFDTSRYWRKKLINVLLPYVAISIPALVVFTTVAHREGMRAGFYEQPVWRQVLEFLVTGAHLAPLWFMPTILLFFLAAPIWIRVFREPRAFSVLPFLFVIPAFVTRGYHQPLQAFVHFTPLWVLGMATHRFSKEFERAMRFGAFPALLLAGTSFLALELTVVDVTHTFYSYLGKVVFCLAMLEMFRRLGDRATRWFATAGTFSFGIYLLHSYVITASKMLEARWLGHLLIGSVLALLAVSSSALGVTMLMVSALRWVVGPQRSRLLIGA
jgi:peptidoglycan/LPS O-acetylase OafA/YrhL